LADKRYTNHKNKKGNNVARLPVPGSDQNQWGSILNDFLAQSHTGDGDLKAGVVGEQQLADSSVSTAKLQPASVTGAKIADGSITAAKLAANVTPASSGINSLFIFYAPPNIVNGKYSDDYAAGLLSRYDDVILGGGLENPGDTYYASTQSIVQKVAAISPGTTVWGYIDTGVTTGNLSLSTIQAQIDQWLALGVHGIFLDTFGYDYHTPRARQNSILTYVHGKGVPAFINAWDSDDAFGSGFNITYNPTSTPTAATAGDIYLLESWICNSDAYSAPYFTTISDIKTRGDKAVAYRSSLGIKLYATNIMLHTGTDEATLARYFGICEGIARAWRLDGSGMGASAYSSTGADLAVAIPRFSPYRPLPKRVDVPYVLNNTWTEVYASDLGITITYDPGTSTYSWQQL
jgi:hypothetical protein